MKETSLFFLLLQEYVLQCIQKTIKETNKRTKRKKQREENFNFYFIIIFISLYFVYLRTLAKKGQLCTHRGEEIFLDKMK